MPPVVPRAISAYCHHAKLDRNTIGRFAYAFIGKSRYNAANAATPIRLTKKDTYVRARPADDSQREGRQHAGYAEDGVKTQKQEQAEKGPRDRREERVAIDVRPRARQQRSEEQRLHREFRIRITRKPDFCDVERQEARGREGRCRSDEPAASEVHRQHAKDGPDTDRSPCPREAIESVADRNRRRKEMRKLPDSRAGLGVLQEETHEAQAVVVEALIRGKKQVARKWRH